MWQRYSDHAKRVVFRAQEHAAGERRQAVRSEHLLLGLLDDDAVAAAQLLEAAEVSRDKLRDAIQRPARSRAYAGGDMYLDKDAKRVIDQAYEEARLRNENYIGTAHLLIGASADAETPAGAAFARVGVGREELRDVWRKLGPHSATEPAALGLRKLPIPAQGGPEQDPSLPLPVEASEGCVEVLPLPASEGQPRAARRPWWRRRTQE